MATQNGDVALRKRQQIAKANRMMFVWVAAVSAVVGIALVVSINFLQRIAFTEKILGEKSKTASTLQKNNQVINDLKDKIRVLNTNQSLIDASTPADSQPVQVILDALPADANSAALGASLQQKLIPGNGITIDSFSVTPVPGLETQGDSAVQDASSTTATSGNAINFHFVVSSSDVSAFKELLQRLEKSIRAIDVTSFALESQGSRYTLTIDGRGFYEPAKTVDLQDKAVKP